MQLGDEIRVPGKTARDFAALCGTMLNLKLMNCLSVEVSIQYFQTIVGHGLTETTENEMMGNGGLLYICKNKVAIWGDGGQDFKRMIWGETQFNL